MNSRYMYPNVENKKNDLVFKHKQVEIRVACKITKANNGSWR